MENEPAAILTVEQLCEALFIGKITHTVCWGLEKSRGFALGAHGRCLSKA